MRDKIAETMVILLSEKGKSPNITGRVIKGLGRGRDLGFPTINLKPVKGRIPPYGIYAVRCRIGRKAYLGVGSVGLNPTYKDKGFSVEVHLFEWNEEAPKVKMEVSFLHKIRDEAAFDTSEDLAAQMHQDVMAAKAFFGLEEKDNARPERIQS